MSCNNNKQAQEFLDLIRAMVQEELKNKDATCVCRVESYNTDGTFNLNVLPDMNTSIKRIQNASKYELNKGDFVILYKINNQLSNSFIMTKIGG